MEAHVAEHRQVIESYGVHLQAVHASPAPMRNVKLGHSTGIGFAFAVVLIVAVGIAGWLNFALLERPMAEVVGDSYRVMGVPIYRLAALAIIVLEVAVGIVLLEALGLTTMFPQFERLEQKKGQRLAIIVVMTTALVVLALIEGRWRSRRDEISRLEREAARGHWPAPRRPKPARPPAPWRVMRRRHSASSFPLPSPFWASPSKR